MSNFTTNPNEETCYQFLRTTLGLNNAATSGILANIYRESTFRTGEYGDSGTSYGICQWHDSRLIELQDFCRENRLNYTNITGQLSFLEYELTTGRNITNSTNLLSDLKRTTNSAQGAYEAAYDFCINFERPAGGRTTAQGRGNDARNLFWPVYGSRSSSSTPVQVESQSFSIVAEAEKHLGKAYSRSNRKGPNSFDCSGLVGYVYKHAIGYNALDSLNSIGQYNHLKNRLVDKNSPKAGDILFFIRTNPSHCTRNPEIHHVGIATGNGLEMINAQNERVGVVVGNAGNWGGEWQYYAAARVVGDVTSTPYILGSGASTPTGGSNSPTTSGASVSGFTSLSMVDSYQQRIAANLSKVDASGYDYGYLWDMDHEGVFKFYIPEFTERAGANWSDIAIRGRSVTVKSYESTSSRVIEISLDLYAGVGLYDKNDSEDIVGELHRDANFVKSLEYPDYSQAIIRPPSNVHLILGSVINLQGVVSNVSVQHMKPLDDQNRSMYIKLSFTVTQTAVNPPDYSDIKNGITAIRSSENITYSPAASSATPSNPSYETPGDSSDYTPL